MVASGRASAREEQETKLLCDLVLTPEQAVATLGRALHLEVDAERLSRDELSRVQVLLASQPGSCEVFLRLLNAAREVLVRSRNTRVGPTRELLSSLRELLGPERVRLVCVPPPAARSGPGERNGRPAPPGRPPRAASRVVDRPRSQPRP